MRSSPSSTQQTHPIPPRASAAHVQPVLTRPIQEEDALYDTRPHSSVRRYHPTGEPQQQQVIARPRYDVAVHASPPFTYTGNAPDGTTIDARIRATDNTRASATPTPAAARASALVALRGWRRDGHTTAIFIGLALHS